MQFCCMTCDMFNDIQDCLVAILVPKALTIVMLCICPGVVCVCLGSCRAKLHCG